MGAVLGFVKRTAFRKGVVGTSSRWLGLWVLIAGAQQVRKRLGKEEVLVERITLKKGQGIEIRDTGVDRGSFEAP
jgi:hypothetical protein